MLSVVHVHVRCVLSSFCNNLAVCVREREREREMDALVFLSS